MQVEAWRLLAMRDALIHSDVEEAYHQLRMIADPECVVQRERGDHFALIQDEAQADGLPPIQS